MSSLRMSVLFLVVVICMTGISQAQTRKPVDPTADAVSRDVTARDVSKGVVSYEKAATPNYSVSPSSGGGAPVEWGVISFRFDTAPEWIDELTFRFCVLSMKDANGKRTFSKYMLDVPYMDIEKGRRHYATVFLKPSALKRYGDVVAAAVEVIAGGETLATEKWEAGGANLVKQWWTAEKVTAKSTPEAREDYLIPRSKTPWVFVDFDKQEVEK